MTTTMATPATTTRVSLRDVREAAYRALTAHGASHGEARAASRMVLDAELLDGTGLATLLDDLAREPWTRSPVEVASAGEPTALVLGAAASNRLLREAPLALELLASDGDVSLVDVPCDPAGAAVLDTVALDLAQVSGLEMAVIVHTAQDSPTGGPAQVRLARPDGALGTGILPEPPSRWREVMTASGVLSVQDTAQLGDPSLSWVTAADRAQTRARAASTGLEVDAGQWPNAYAASRRYLVPDRA